VGGPVVHSSSASAVLGRRERMNTKPTAMTATRAAMPISNGVESDAVEPELLPGAAEAPGVATTALEDCGELPGAAEPPADASGRALGAAFGALQLRV